MGFPKGHKGFGQSRKGIPNRRTTDFLSVLEARGFCAATAMIDIYEEAKSTYENYAIIHEAIKGARDQANHETGQFAAPTEDKAHQYLKIAADMAKELASYSYPKRKAIETIPAIDQSIKAEQANELLKMDDKQMLEFMREKLRLIASQQTNE